MLMIGKQLTAQQRVNKAVVDIMGQMRYIALAGVLMVGNRTVKAGIPTACTNGRDEIYGEEFVDSLNDAELRFLILHECYHKLYRHLTTWRWMYDEDAHRANLACDYVINLKIMDENKDGFATMPCDKKTGKPLGVVDEKYRGMSAGDVFRLLPKNEDQPQDGDECEDGEGGDDDGRGTPSNKPSNKSKPGNGGSAGLDDHDWKGAQQMSDEEKKELDRDIDEAVRQGVLAAGKLGSGGRRDLEELLQPKIDWREVLREFVSTTCTGNDFSTWRRPNRRFISSGVYMPSGISEQVGELVIAIDTSGSIGGREIAQFLGELSAICETVKPDVVRLLYWDTRVCRDEKYIGEDVRNIIASTKPAGGGGTRVSCVCEYMTANAIAPQAVVVLTDGMLGNDWGKWSVPVLWCVMGTTATSPNGKTVHIKD